MIEFRLFFYFKKKIFMENMDNRKKFIIQANNKFYSTLKKFFDQNDIQSTVRFRKLMQKNEVGQTIEIQDNTSITYKLTKHKLL